MTFEAKIINGSVCSEPFKHLSQLDVLLLKPLREQPFQPTVLYLEHGKLVVKYFGSSGSSPATKGTTTARWPLALRLIFWWNRLRAVCFHRREESRTGNILGANVLFCRGRRI
ncbi:hypothetical protein SAMN03159448_06308 [Sinorhizobium sp. NFACC03]|nr:hypothetical protein SAMN03159448_06308 [Sinorhizobium sp. NFACC03]